MRTPPLALYTAPYRLLGDADSTVCCYGDCACAASCWLEGTGATWSVMTEARRVPGKDRAQSFEFCLEHGLAVAERRMARTKPRTA